MRKTGKGLVIVEAFITAIRNALKTFLPAELARLAAPLCILAVILLVLLAIGTALVKTGKIKKETFAFYAFIMPWLVGFFVFNVYPVCFSIITSFFKWDIVSPREFVGLDNYRYALEGKDKYFYQSIKVTFLYTFLNVPLGIVYSFLIALMLNQKIRGIAFFRTAFYLPSLVSGVAVSTLWAYIFKYNYGLLNIALEASGLEPVRWLGDPKMVIPSLVLMGLWGVGGSTIIMLAGLQDIPQDICEAAIVDGAGPWMRFKHITIPMMSPIIFFNLVNGFIGSFQYFTQAYLMTEGGPNGASMFYVLNLYNQAFSYFRIGYACALAWILFVIIIVFTALIFRYSSFWVYYETEVKSKKIKVKKGGRK